jgi:hypothetical protein
MPPGQHAQHGRAGQEGHRTTARVRPDLVQQLGRLVPVEVVGQAVGARGHLAGDLGGDAGLAALLGHVVQLAREGTDALDGPPLLLAGLAADLRTSLADEVAGLLLGLPDHVRGLLLGRLRDLSTGLGRGLPDLAGLLLGAVATPPAPSCCSMIPPQ